jgi:hypothetical protein
LAEQTHTWLHLSTGCFNCLEENFSAYTLNASANLDCDVLRVDESGVLGQEVWMDTAGNPHSAFHAVARLICYYFEEMFHFIIVHIFVMQYHCFAICTEKNLVFHSGMRTDDPFDCMG